MTGIPLLHALPMALLPFLDPKNLIDGFGAFALLGVCLIVFAETGLLVGFILPGDTLLIITGLLAHPGSTNTGTPVIDIPIWVICIAISFAAFLGGELGYLIGKKFGPALFERKESGLFSKANVERTKTFMVRWGAIAIVLARFVPIVRTFAPLVAGVGHMPYKRYSLYNAVGALLWGAGITFLGWLLGYFPPIANFVSKYIDLILAGAICVAVVPAIIHYIQGVIKARKQRSATDTK